MGKIASRWAKTASRCGNIVVRKCQKERERERERERETAKTETETEKTETETTETETDRDRQRERRERGERERVRERRGGRTCARRLSRLRRIPGIRPGGQPPSREGRSLPGRSGPLLEKDATGTPEVPVPVLHREGLFGPPPTEDVDGAHLARTNSRTLHSARIVHSFTVPCSLTALAALADRSFFNCYGLVVGMKLTA